LLKWRIIVLPVGYLYFLPFEVLSFTELNCYDSIVNDEWPPCS